MKILVINSERVAWDAFVESAHGATSYHRFGWKGVISKSFGHRCYYLAAVDDRGEWQGVLPLVHMRSKVFGNFMVSVPFVNYGGPICANEMAAQLLLNEAERLQHSIGATHVELRHLGRNCRACQRSNIRSL
jgi:serine/alanine adding enzyme